MIIANKYELHEELGQGGFGVICKGQNIRTGEEVAIKIEPINNERQTIKYETRIYQYLTRMQMDGISKLKWFGVDEDYYYLVVSLLSDSLQSLKNRYNRFSLKTILQIGIQGIDRLQFMHNTGLIHRDIKPANLLIGLRENANKIYLIDFGIAKKYLDEDQIHKINTPIKSIIGSEKFVSLNVHNLNQPSRRDDIESLINVLIYCYLGDLKSKEGEDFLLYKSNLERNPNVPSVLSFLLKYIRGLEYDVTPNYDLMQSIFKKAIEDNGYELDNAFDWS